MKKLYSLMLAVLIAFSTLNANAYTKAGKILAKNTVGKDLSADPQAAPSFTLTYADYGEANGDLIFTQIGLVFLGLGEGSFVEGAEFPINGLGLPTSKLRDGESVSFNFYTASYSMTGQLITQFAGENTIVKNGTAKVDLIENGEGSVYIISYKVNLNNVEKYVGEGDETPDLVPLTISGEVALTNEDISLPE